MASIAGRAGGLDLVLCGQCLSALLRELVELAGEGEDTAAATGAVVHGKHCELGCGE